MQTFIMHDREEAWVLYRGAHDDMVSALWLTIEGIKTIIGTCF